MSADIEKYRPGELVERDVVDGWIAVVGDVSKLATMVADTDFVPKALQNNPAAIAAAILAGREAGIPPMRALQHLHMVEGRPSMSAEQKRAQALAAGHEIVYVETTTTRCVVKGRRAGSDQWTTVTWSMDDAKKAGLSNRGTYQKHPRRMLQARATGELCDLLFPDATGGLATYEQLVDDTDAPTAATDGHAAPVRRTARRRTPTKTAQSAEAEPTGAVQEVTPAERRSAPKATVPEPPLPGEDGYDDEPAPAAAVAEAEDAGGATRAQLTRLHTTMSKIGIEDRGERLRVAATIVGRPLASSTEMGIEEAGVLIDTLSNIAASDDPEGNLAALMAEMSGGTDHEPIDAELVDDQDGDQ